MNYLFRITRFVPILLLVACGTTKATIYSGNKIYKYSDGKDGNKDTVIEYKIDKCFKADVIDKSSYLKIETIKDNHETNRLLILSAKEEEFIEKKGLYYTNESSKFVDGKKFSTRSFIYSYGKISLSSATIPFKFRKSVGNDSINPATVETGVNLNFAPSFRYTWSFLNPSRNLFGNPVNNVSLSVSPIMLGLGVADLKKASNAPGIVSDRKAMMLSYGGMIMIGFNSFGIGFAMGGDNILGPNNKHWLYKNKCWFGIGVSLDLVK